MKDTIAVSDAALILGSERVINASLIGKAFVHSENALYEKTGYTREQLESAADSNNKGLANWFLVYHSGKSPKEILNERFENLEFGFGETDRFYKNHWFSYSNESFWTEKKEKAGYYLLNFGGEEDESRELRFESMTFSEQEEKIRFLFEKRRAPFNIVMEAVFSIYDSFGILLLKQWKHLSDTRIHDGRLLYLGGTASKSNKKMMNVFGFPKEQESDPKYYYGFGMVLLMRKWE
ncbi:MAG: hypothetical protein LiPW41_220 [Parcubacteria group bacterium LiPW_41]|nr:MAG: hypothetical protein LiPW41_220 [Parcubacteria group bacterium LiPW_41]